MQSVIFHKIQRLQEETSYILTNRDRFLSNLRVSTDIRRAVERSVFLCAEMVLDVADLVLVKKGHAKSPTYREAIYNLGKFGIIPEDFAYHFVYIAGLRNFLAHDYLKDTTATLEDFLTHKISDVERFINLVQVES